MFRGREPIPFERQVPAANDLNARPCFRPVLHSPDCGFHKSAPIVVIANNSVKRSLVVDVTRGRRKIRPFVVFLYLDPSWWRSARETPEREGKREKETGEEGQ